MSWDIIDAVRGRSLFGSSTDITQIPTALAIVASPPILDDTGARDTTAERRAFGNAGASELHFMGVCLLTVLATPDPHALHHAIARTVLAELRVDDVTAVDLLARELAVAAGGLQRALRPDQAEVRPASDAAIDGIFHYDALAADWVERSYGAYGAAYAAEVRTNARARWEAYTRRNPLFAGILPGDAPLFVLWVDPSEFPFPARWPLGLCRDVLWPGVVQPKMEREFTKHAPALPLEVWTAQHDVRHATEIQDAGHEVHALNDVGEVVGRFASPVLDQAAVELLRSGIEHLPRLTVERLLRGWARDVFDQARRGVNPFTRLVYAGGWEGLAERYDINSKDRAMLPGIIEALYLYRGSRRSLPAIVADRWLRAASPGRRAELRLDIGEVLAPGYVHRLPSNVTGRDRWLLPVLVEPYLFGRRNDHQALCDLQWDILILFRERAERLKTGGVPITASDMRTLAARRHLDDTVVGQAILEWSSRPDAWLRPAAAGRYTLMDENANALLVEAANITENARKGGAARAARQRRDPDAPKRLK